MDKRRKLVVILAEAAIEQRLVSDAERLGARGWTAVDARGSGQHGVREGAWEADRAVRVEVLCDEETAERFVTHVQDTYFEHFAIGLYTTDVRVLRSHKFRKL